MRNSKWRLYICVCSTVDSGLPGRVKSRGRRRRRKSIDSDSNSEADAVVAPKRRKKKDSVDLTPVYTRAAKTKNSMSSSRKSPRKPTRSDSPDSNQVTPTRSKRLRGSGGAKRRAIHPTSADGTPLRRSQRLQRLANPSESSGDASAGDSARSESGSDADDAENKSESVDEEIENLRQLWPARLFQAPAVGEAYESDDEWKGVPNLPIPNRAKLPTECGYVWRQFHFMGCPAGRLRTFARFLGISKVPKKTPLGIFLHIRFYNFLSMDFFCLFCGIICNSAWSAASDAQTSHLPELPAAVCH